MIAIIIASFLLKVYKEIISLYILLFYSILYHVKRRERMVNTKKF